MSQKNHVFAAEYNFKAQRPEYAQVHALLAIEQRLGELVEYLKTPRYVVAGTEPRPANTPELYESASEPYDSEAHIRDMVERESKKLGATVHRYIPPEERDE